MDLPTLEGIAIELHRRHGFDPERPPSTMRLARAMFGPGCIVRPPTMLGAAPSSTFVLAGARRICVRRTVPRDELAFYVAHELAHAELGQPHGAGAQIEAACDYLAAALIAPRPAVLALHRAFGWDLAAIAEEVVATQTWAALRLAEALLEPLAAVSPSLVRVRGPEEWVWPDEDTLRLWARRAGPGIRRIPVTDRPRRAVLVVAS